MKGLLILMFQGNCIQSLALLSTLSQSGSNFALSYYRHPLTLHLFAVEGAKIVHLYQKFCLISCGKPTTCQSYLLERQQPTPCFIR